MARDNSASGTISQATVLHAYLSSWEVNETAGATADVKFRDGFNPGAAITAVDGAAGNVTAGVHYYTETVLTAQGESVVGNYTAAGFNSAGTVIVNLTVPTIKRYDDTALAIGRDIIAGRNIYVTKAGAPATNVVVTPTQWFLVATAPSTTLTAANNNLELGLSTSITLTSGAAFAASGRAIVATNMGSFVITYTGNAANVLSGVTNFGQVPRGALMQTNGAVTAASIQDNTTTTFAFNVADGSLTATNPPTKDTAGSRLAEVQPNASGSAGDNFGGNICALQNGGFVTVEVTSGTVRWIARGM